MTNDDEVKGKSSVGGVGKTKGVKATEEVSEVGKVEKASSVGGVGKVGEVRGRQATRMMSASERDAFFQMIEEEAEKMFQGTGMSEEKKAVIKDAVKMAVDASIIEED